MRYEQYELGKLATIQKVKGLPLDKYESGNIPYVTGSQSNNGVVGYVKAPEEAISKGNCIAVDPIKGFCMYQPNNFVGRGFSGASINLLYIDKLNELSAMYIIAAIEKYSTKIASYANLFNSNRLATAKITLPTLDELDENSPYSDEGYIPDFDYMQERIAKLEQERIVELEQYLIATGLNDYQLTEEDVSVLKTFLDNCSPPPAQKSDSEDVNRICKEFKVSDLFIVEGTKSLDAGALEFKNNGVNFVGRTDENNGVQGKIDRQSFEPNDANTLTATVIGNYKYVKYQEEPYYCSQNVNKLTPMFPITQLLGLYFRNMIQKFVSLYDGQQGGYKLNELKDYTFELPVQTDDNKNPIIDSEHKYHPDGYIPDWDFMEKYIRAIEKVVIADVVRYKDEMITKTQNIISGQD